MRTRFHQSISWAASILHEHESSHTHDTFTTNQSTTENHFHNRNNPYHTLTQTKETLCMQMCKCYKGH